MKFYIKITILMSIAATTFRTFIPRAARMVEFYDIQSNLQPLDRFTTELAY